MIQYKLLTASDLKPLATIGVSGDAKTIEFKLKTNDKTLKQNLESLFSALAQKGGYTISIDEQGPKLVVKSSHGDIWVAFIQSLGADHSFAIQQND